MDIFAHGTTFFRRMGWLAITGTLFFFLTSAPCGSFESGNKQIVHLYFADRTQPYLVTETRVLVHADDPASFGRQLVEELVKGSTNDNMATIPEGAALRSLFYLEDGTAVVDFTESMRKNHPGSCRMEQLTLFSVVNSLVLNIPEIERVKFLVAGEEISTLAGCMPLDSPLTADMLLTR
jgi:spore germination protein GerM